MVARRGQGKGELLIQRHKVSVKREKLERSVVQHCPYG